jgi:hypothetical protein
MSIWHASFQSVGNLNQSLRKRQDVENTRAEMTTTLQDQLQRIAAAAGVRTAKQPRGKPSLLYTFQEAADIGVHDIYGIALQGTQQLLAASLFASSAAGDCEKTFRPA